MLLKRFFLAGASMGARSSVRAPSPPRSTFEPSMTLRKLPIGIQDFPSLREEGYLYVDKTRFVHKLATEGRVYFLSRPRRFGKSLLLSTLGAYFEGRKEVFEGLAIASLEKDWIEYPVIRIDLNGKEYGQGRDYLLLHLNRRLEENAARYGVVLAESTPDERLGDLIQALHAKSGQKVAVLVDEYDKPLLDTLHKPELHDALRDTLRAFYSVLKSADEHLKFVFLTGVTKFGQVSVFSGLNQLNDLSLHPEYATLCGITETELLENFQPELDALAGKQKLSLDDCLGLVRRWYNGYRFDDGALGVYNPFSTLRLFSTGKFQDFWFQTGTPTFLVELLKKTDADLREIDGVELPAEAFADYRAEADRPIPVLYQSGYLTIQGYDPEIRTYKLGFPNAEVKNGFLTFLLPDFTAQTQGKGGFHIGMFSKELRAGDVEAFLTRMRSFFGNIPYDLNDQTERHYHVVFYLVFSLLGQFVQSEVKSAIGRSDAVVETADAVFVFEFKLNGTAEQALEQIEARGYLIPYQASGKKLVKVGVEFDKATRNLGRWLIA